MFTQLIEMRMNEMLAGIRADVGIKLFGAAEEVLEVVELLGTRTLGEVVEGQRRFDLAMRLLTWPPRPASVRCR